MIKVRSVLIIFWAVFAVMMAADVITTQLALDLAPRAEGVLIARDNPLISLLPMWAIAILKMVVVLAVGGLIPFYSCYPRRSLLVYGLLAVGMTLVVGWNLSIIVVLSQF